MNNRQYKKRSKKLNSILFEEVKIKGKKIYSYTVVHNNLIIIGFTAKPKQKGCRAFPQKYILEELRLYGHKAAYELNVLF